MPLYTFHCLEGHVTEMLGPFSLELISCACGKPAQRAEVNRILFGFTGVRGETIAHYYEAASEAKHAHDSTDDPQAKAATRPDIWRPAFYRSRNKLQEKVLMGAESDAWVDPNPGKSEREIREVSA